MASDSESRLALNGFGVAATGKEAKMPAVEPLGPTDEAWSMDGVRAARLEADAASDDIL